MPTQGSSCRDLQKGTKIDSPSTARPSPIQTDQPSASCLRGAYLQISDIGTLPVYTLSPVGVASTSASPVTTRRTTLRCPSAPTITSAWRISPVLSLTLGRNVHELGPAIKSLVLFSGGASGAGCTDSTTAPKVTRAPADKARR